ncbi:MAG: tryptophan--tRNA ligase [Bdellovibrionaceae bacterium]|nr:tryptophan--tRNA ligase [Pseudobdellovibrionaceae bacterium]NUM58176.1 tryptophan--tRNA ligase [Pseudobdellovibrionaceae bacterium]
MEAKKQKVMSGIRVTGDLHIGHYWGALKNWLSLQDQYECFFGVMDWHGQTTIYKRASEISALSREMFAEMVAWGVDPKKSTMFIQSKVPEHLELFMIFANLTPLGWLERVPTWKDAEEEAKQSDTHNLGRFAYPVLQAADIAIYQGALVPVGQDQIAHLELTREIIRRFNHLYKAKLPEPRPLLTEVPALPGLDGRKMSKSYGNSILLTEKDEKSLRKKVNMMVTDPQRVRREDPGEPEVCSVYAYHKLYSSADDLDWVVKGCRSAGIGCGDCKGRLAENMEKLCQGPRTIKAQLLSNTDELDKSIEENCERARQIAKKTLETIRYNMKWL